MNFAVIILSGFYVVWSNKVLDLDSEDLWTHHKNKHGLKFNAHEESERREIFLKNLRFIGEYNSRKNGVTLKMNKFGHMRESEIKFGLRIDSSYLGNKPAELTKSALPIRSSVDWRNYSVVTIVKNQEDCGSCYAFSAVGAIESHSAIRKGVLEELSEQEVVDCSTEYQNAGCDGGWPTSVFQYAMKRGLCLGSDYPYNAEENLCVAKHKRHVDKLLGYVAIPTSDEDGLIRALSFFGPVSICLNANHMEFYYYSSGIIDITDCGGSSLTHAVLAVGYNTEVPKPYLIVKNSWGSDWGENGYFRIALHKNMCGIANAASYPIIGEHK